MHPSYITGKGGEGLNTVIRSYVFDEAFSYFAPSLIGGEDLRSLRTSRPVSRAIGGGCS